MDAKSAQSSVNSLKKNGHNIRFFGHTHVQEVFPDLAGDLEWLDDSRFKIPAGLPCVVMVGAVGQPRYEFDRRACWVLWDSDAKVVEFRKTEYDPLLAAGNIVDAEMPVENVERLLNGEEITQVAWRR